MTSKERVLTTLASQKPDRVPINYDANAGIDKRLKEHFGLQPDDSEGLSQALGVDFRGVGAPYRGPKLHRDIPEGKFVTLVLIDLDAESHRARLLSAGHGPTFVVRDSNGDVRTLGSQGMPLGLTEDQMMDGPIETSLEPGDLVVAVSDGFFEWADAADEAFGLERLQEVIRINRHLSAEEILAAMERAVADFVGNLPQQDDVTGLVRWGSTSH